MLELYKLYNHYNENKERYRYNKMVKQEMNGLFIFYFIIGFINVYLSWNCNTAQGLNTGLKVVYAIGAFMFGIMYLVFYGVFRSGTCKAGMCS